MIKRKAHKLAVKCKQVALSSLRHKVIALWEHGCFMENWQFRPKCNKKVIEYVQSTYPQYAVYGTAKSFFYRALKRHKLALAGESPHLDAHRDRSGENRRKTKRENQQIMFFATYECSENIIFNLHETRFFFAFFKTECAFNPYDSLASSFLI